MLSHTDLCENFLPSWVVSSLHTATMNDNSDSQDIAVSTSLCPHLFYVPYKRQQVSMCECFWLIVRRSTCSTTPCNCIINSFDIIVTSKVLCDFWVSSSSTSYLADPSHETPSHMLSYCWMAFCHPRQRVCECPSTEMQASSLCEGWERFAEWSSKAVSMTKY